MDQFLQKVLHKVIKSIQKAWLKSYINMNIELKMIDFEKSKFKLINNAISGKNIENVRNHRNIKLITTDQEETVTQQKSFQKLYQPKKGKICRSSGTNQFFLRLPILEISKIVMYEFWYGQVKPTY